MKITDSFKFVFPLVLLITGLYLFPLNIFDTDFSKIPGDLGDARFNNYVLEHGYLYLSGEVESFWNAPFMYPEKNVIAYSDNHLGTIPMYSLFRILNFDRETSFQLWILLQFCLNFICCYYVLMRCSRNIILAGTGAYIFAFSIFILGHSTNAQTFPRFMIPLIVYWSWLYLTQNNVKFLVFACLGIVYQFWCGIYTGFFLLYILMFILISYLIIYRDQQFFIRFTNLKSLRNHFLVFIASALLLFPLMYPYLEILNKTGYRSYEVVELSIPTFRSYFFSSNGSFTWNILSEHAKSTMPYWWYHVMFMGAVPWLSVALVFVILASKKVSKQSKRIITLILCSLILSIIFSLNVNGYSLYYFIFSLPGFGSLRSINRVMNTEIILFVFLFVFVFIELKRIYPKLKYFIYMLPLLVVLDNLIIPNEVVRFDKEKSQMRISGVRQTILEQIGTDKGPIAYFPIDMAGKELETHLDVMLACQELRISCVNAYSGTIPDSLMEFFIKGNNEGLTRWVNSHQIEEKSITKVSDAGYGFSSKKMVKLIAANGKYVSADHSQGDFLMANRAEAYQWETFSLITYSDTTNAIICDNLSFVCADILSQQELVANRKERKSWETFKIVWLNDNQIAIKASNDKFVSLDTSRLMLHATGIEIGENEKFKVVYE